MKGATISSMASTFESKGDLEQKIESALVKAGMATDKQVLEKEQKDFINRTGL